MLFMSFFVLAITDLWSILANEVFKEDEFRYKAFVINDAIIELNQMCSQCAVQIK